jgi:hypothetical protein
MMSGRTSSVLFALCAIAWVVIVARAWFNVKSPEDFKVTVSQGEVQAFARAQLDALQPQSFAQGRELCAILFEDSSGDLGASPLRAGAEASCDIAYFDEPGMAPLASIHTHGGFDRGYDSEVPSLNDLQSDIASRTDGYIATPGGRLWRIDWRKERAVLVCGEGCLAQDPAYRSCRDDAISPEYTVPRLAARQRGPGDRC